MLGGSADGRKDTHIKTISRRTMRASFGLDAEAQLGVQGERSVGPSVLPHDVTHR